MPDPTLSDDILAERLALAWYRAELKNPDAVFPDVYVASGYQSVARDVIRTGTLDA